MKKFLSFVILSSMLLSSIFVSVNAAESVDVKVNRITWEHAYNLDAQKGFDENIGTAGLLAGTIDDYIIVGGGANFPYESVLNGGAKKSYSDLYLFKQNGNKLELKEHTNLDYEIGYGNSISTTSGIYYIGGSPEGEKGKDIILIKLDENKKITYEKVGNLPFTLSDGIAAEYEGKFYLGLGKQDGKASNKFYEYDIKTNTTKELAEIPGEKTRNQSVAQILNGNLYVFSGGDATAYTDGYKYDIKNKKWTDAASVSIDNKKISLLGANSIKINKNEMLVIGGFNKEVYDDAVKNLNSLKDKELDEFRQDYFTRDPFEFNWNRNILIYNSEKDTWSTIGEIPFDGPCGGGLVLLNNNIYSINGEIKPGIRTNKIFSGTIIK